VIDEFGAKFFAMVLLVLTIITGILFVLDLVVFRKQRRALADAAVARFDSGEALSIRAGEGDDAVAQARKRVIDGQMRQPWWLEWTAGLFPVIAAVFFLRSFIAEPFRIPSGSMIPTLLVGDLILVNKYTYGIRMPVTNSKIIATGSPQRGDVVVFRYPPNERAGKPSVDYIKRVIGVPGDVIEYADKRLVLNGKEVLTTSTGPFLDPERAVYLERFTEQIGEVSHAILKDSSRPSSVMPVEGFDYAGACDLLANGVKCTVPAGKYFVMGDNRDNSIDSRFWGFVDDQHVVGKAFFVWMNFSNISRIGRIQ
jgi:signal peptidase I